MKSIMTVVFSFCLLISFAQQGGDTNVNSNGIALGGYDAVAYHADGKAVEGYERFSVEHDDVTYYFSNEKSQWDFRENPEKYVPAYGGYCAYGFTIDKETTGYDPGKYPVDPTVFKIEDGKLLLFYSGEYKDKWDSNPSECSKKANALWSELTD